MVILKIRVFSLWQQKIFLFVFLPFKLLPMATGIASSTFYILVDIEGVISLKPLISVIFNLRLQNPHSQNYQSTNFQFNCARRLQDI